MSSSSSVFKTPDCLAFKLAWLCSGIKTCRSHTAAFALVLEPGKGWSEPTPPLVGTGSHPALDKFGPRECCSHFDRHLSGRVASRLDISSKEDKSLSQTSELLSTVLLSNTVEAVLSENKAAMGNRFEPNHVSVCTNSLPLMKIVVSSSSQALISSK